MPRFLVTLSRGLLEIFRLSEPRAVTLTDGTPADARALTPISAPDATNDGPSIARGNDDAQLVG